MTTFVLVHGAWHGPWAWDRVTPLLHEAGARTIAPALTFASGVGLHDHVREVVAALVAAPQDRDLVLVGHSYAGLVVRQAADVRPDLVGHVVLVDGWAGADGDSLFTLAPEGFVNAIRSSTPDGDLIPAPPPAMFGITDPEDADWLAQRLRPQPLRAFTEPTRLRGAVAQLPGTAIHCRPERFPFALLAKQIGYQTIAMDGPHDVMITGPTQLAQLLLAIQEQEVDGIQ